jgi:hypothetical protein
MIEINSYTHSVMINFFDNMLVAMFAAFAAYAVDETFGHVVYALVSIFLIYLTTTSWQKIINPMNSYKNCWYKGGK